MNFMKATIRFAFLFLVFVLPGRLCANVPFWTLDDRFTHYDTVVIATVTNIREAGEYSPGIRKGLADLMVESVLKGDAVPEKNLEANFLLGPNRLSGSTPLDLYVGRRARFFINTSREVYLGGRNKTRIYETWLGGESAALKPDSLPGEAAPLPVLASAPDQTLPAALPEPRSLDQRFASRELVVIGNVARCARVRGDVSGRDLWAAEITLKIVPKGNAPGKTLTVFFHAATNPEPDSCPAVSQFPEEREVRLFLTRRAVESDASPVPYLELASDVTVPDERPGLKPGQVFPP